MMHKPTDEDASTSAFAAALWIWTIVIAIGTAITFGNAFARQSAYSGSSFNAGAAFGGLLVGAFSTIPFWALFSLAKHVLRNIIKLRTDLASHFPAAQTRPANAVPPRENREVQNWQNPE